MRYMTRDFLYPSRRMPVFARNMVATSQPLAAQAGLRMLKKGGNAVDAAVASAIALTVVEPTSNGLGSDAFALVWDEEKGELTGLNGSGRSPAAWNPEHFSRYSTMPLLGWDAVTVPGAVSTWVTLSERFGKLMFRELFLPAVGYAREGFPVSPITAMMWKRTEGRYREFPEFGATFLPRGRAPEPGEIFRCEAMARSLELIAGTGGEAFYRGELGQLIAGHARETGGLLTEEDLASHAPEWVKPISIGYRGVRLHELPPNGQGLVALVALGILDHWDVGEYLVDSADSLHLQIEAMKLALADGYRYVADPLTMDTDVGSLLTPDYLSRRSELIDMERTRDPGLWIPHGQGTVYLTTADAEGNMVSFIQSNYMGFGSGIVVPGTGISLQDRGAGFNLEKGHPNQVDGGKRPFHTIIPAFVTITEEGSDQLHPMMSFGVMGGPFQPQGHTQLMVRVFDHRQNPQTAIDAPRWQVFPGNEVAVEPGFDNSVLKDLQRKGHRITTDREFWCFGGAQAILGLRGGTYCGASDPRKDGQAVGF